MKILLLEDNKRLNETIVKKLEMNGFKVDSFLDGKEAYDSIYNGYDCFVLDINVPSQDGISLLKDIRKSYSDIPTIIISSTIELETITDAYKIGCDDYLKKPFYIDELLFKINKLCHITEQDFVLSDDIIFNIKDKELKAYSQVVKLTKKESNLLSLFVRNKNKIISFEHIQNYVWEGELTSTDSIRTLVMRLRKKLPKELIETLVDVGYRLNIKK